ncbi:hypothetical protein [Flavobacterium sp.]|uniref:hypothetical protein n=1 Tax=Flavobacterium sp. TaxID=239 RepID=UPI00261DA7B2|nr:hypothetical protein [Flavobacterium sp.]
MRTNNYLSRPLVINYAHLFLLVLLTTVCLSASGQNEKVERAALKLEIAANETDQYITDIPASRYFVKEKILQIYCGETLFVECEIQGDSIHKMQVVEKNLNPSKTIEINFSQSAEDRKNIRTNLSVRNPFEKKLSYQAFMFSPKSEQWVNTSIIPVLPKLVNYELWPHAIISLVLVEWKLE